MKPDQGAEREAGSVVFRALDLLELIAGSGRALTLAELCVLMGLPKATVHRLCQRLESERFLAREPGGRHYAVGPKLMRMGLTIVRSGIKAERRAILANLVDAVGETCNFTALAGHEVLYLDRVEARWPLRLHLEPGSRVPLHCTASGKLFLASMPAAKRGRLLDALDLTAFTQHTMTARERLEAELSLIAEQGYSLDREEFLLGLVAIAVPVEGTRGEILAAVACHAPSARFSLADAKEHLPKLREAAERLSATLPE